MDMLSMARETFRRITIITSQRNRPGIPLASLLIQIEIEAQTAHAEILAFQKLMKDGANDNAQQGDH